MRRTQVFLLGCFFVALGCLFVACCQTALAGPASVVLADAIQPQMAIDSRGTIYIVSIHENAIVVSKSTDQGKSFDAPVTALDAHHKAQGGAQRGPRIGVDAEGRLAISAWAPLRDDGSMNSAGAADLFLTTSQDNGTTWSPPSRVNEARGQSPENLHWMAVAPNGQVHLAWLDRRERQRQPGQDLYYAVVVDGRVSANRKLASTICECCAPGLAVDQAANPIVTYREGGQKESREIFAVHSQDGGRGFSQPLQLNTQPSGEKVCPMSAPAVAVSADGKRIATAWKDVRSGGPLVYCRTAADWQFSVDQVVRSDRGGEQNHPSLAVEPSGVFWVAWTNKSDAKRISVRE